HTRCFLYSSVALRDLHSFPTRRSSDLGLHLRRRRTEISLRRPLLIAAPTSTACLDATAISRCKTSRLNRLSADGAKPSSNRCSYSLTNGDSVHSLDSTRHRPLEREGRHLAVSRVGSNALRRTFFRLYLSATRRAAGDVAARLAQRSRWHDEHGDSDPVV